MCRRGLIERHARLFETMTYVRQLRTLTPGDDSALGKTWIAGEDTYPEAFIGFLIF